MGTSPGYYPGISPSHISTRAVMEQAAEPVWNKFHGCCSPGGDRDFFLLVSEGEINSPDVVPRCSVDLRDEDRRRLENQGIPADCYDDRRIIKARVKLDSSLELVGEEVSNSEKELSRGYVLQRLEHILSKCRKAGVVIYYAGHGRKNTGDWCFKDGYITFGDIIELYNTHFKRRVLTIVTDCSYSGKWVKWCSQYLEEQGMRPCGHSARDKGILLKVYASSRPWEIAATPCFSVLAADSDKNKGHMMYFINKQLREEQKAHGVDFAAVTCDKNIDEPCALSPEYTWHKKSEAERIFLVKGDDRDRPAWYYVLVVDDDEKMRLFIEKMQKTNAVERSIDLTNYGQVLESGWGEDPPNIIHDSIEKQYGFK